MVKLLFHQDAISDGLIITSNGAAKKKAVLKLPTFHPIPLVVERYNIADFFQAAFYLAIVVKRFFYSTELVGNYQTLKRGNQQFQTVKHVLPCALNLKTKLNLQTRAEPSGGGEDSVVHSCH